MSYFLRTCCLLSPSTPDFASVGIPPGVCPSLSPHARVVSAKCLTNFAVRLALLPDFRREVVQQSKCLVGTCSRVLFAAATLYYLTVEAREDALES
jgi:hypothetical protein